MSAIYFDPGPSFSSITFGIITVEMITINFVVESALEYETSGELNYLPTSAHCQIGAVPSVTHPMGLCGENVRQGQEKSYSLTQTFDVACKASFMVMISQPFFAHAIISCMYF